MITMELLLTADSWYKCATSDLVLELSVSNPTAKQYCWLEVINTRNSCVTERVC